MEKIQILYHSKEIEKIKKISKGDWIDLRAAEEVHLKKGEFALISLGISMKLPEGYEAHIAPRSSTFKNFGLIQTNGVGIVDGSYCSEKDIYKMPVLAVRDTVVHVNDRICQFRIVENQPEICFEEVEHLEAEERGGFGSTGRE
ncbi:MAG: deoxyuridine 5'-triphosphate nucleotidohydrolase [Lachnospiraceae bacterium]|nr:deoxyuridine 5'-triphosphate nucleotidohydrolase [Robinsoniella sp.]MDY3765848.1 deoxyuridine 5'-triphosphate nucleotidohydrolase [Lachnospiraceae bacterium]